MNNAIKLHTAITDVQMWAIENLRNGINKQDWNRINDGFAKIKDSIDCMGVPKQIKEPNEVLNDLEGKNIQVRSSELEDIFNGSYESIGRQIERDLEEERGGR